MENEKRAEEVIDLASNLDGKLVISIDTINWNEAGKKLKWTVLLKLATGRSNIEETG